MPHPAVDYHLAFYCTFAFCRSLQDADITRNIPTGMFNCTSKCNEKKNTFKTLWEIENGQGNSRHGQLSQRHITMSLNGEHVWWHQTCPHIDCSTGYNTNSSREPLNFKANSPSSCPGQINTSQSSHTACLVIPLSVWTNDLSASYWETEKKCSFTWLKHLEKQ